MIYGEQHSWQGDASVQQILVFHTEKDKISFDITHEIRVLRDGEENASDNGIGAAYKLRAVLTGDGTWASLIRRGNDGNLVYESFDMYETAERALQNSRIVLANF